MIVSSPRGSMRSKGGMVDIIMVGVDGYHYKMRSAWLYRDNLCALDKLRELLTMVVGGNGEVRVGDVCACGEKVALGKGGWAEPRIQFLSQF